MAAIRRRLVALGVSHREACVAQRAPLQLATNELKTANRLLCRQKDVLESTIISTCNRVEFYLVTDEDADPFHSVVAVYDRLMGRDVRARRALFTVRLGRNAVKHLFGVAAGLDSAVLGECEVLGQVKEAYSAACDAGSAGKVIHRLFHQAFRVGKQVRTDTAIGKGACSVSTAAVEMLGERLGERLAGGHVLIVGVNRMTRIAATRLQAEHGCRLTFANRTADKAVTLAGEFGCEGYGLDALPALVAGADVTICCTASSDPIITRRMMARVVQGTEPKRRLLVDLAIPRDVDIPKAWSPLVEILDLDDIGQFVVNRQRERAREIPHAQAILRVRLNEFQCWYESVLEPSIAACPRSQLPPEKASQIESGSRAASVSMARVGS